MKIFLTLLFCGGRGLPTVALILYYASNMISDGSELLLLIPSLAGVVGSCVLPILGSVDRVRLLTVKLTCVLSRMLPELSRME